MKIDIVVTDKSHPMVSVINSWSQKYNQLHEIRLVHSLQDLQGGDLLILAACQQILKPAIREKYGKALVTHASDLPKGKGWSPHVWTALRNEPVLVLSLFEAVDAVDAGPIWAKFRTELRGIEVASELSMLLAKLMIEALDFAVENFATVVPISQDDVKSETLPRRSPADSELDPEKSIADQFDLLRVCDPDRYPAYFVHRGRRYILRLEPKDEIPE